MAVQNPIPFSKVIDALLDERTPFSPRYLHRLSDIEPEESTILENSWPNISLHRREALLEDMEEIHLEDTVLSFEEVGRIALKDKEPGVRRRAIQILREYELVDLLPKFIDLAENDADVEVRSASTTALATYVYLGEVEDISPKKLLEVEDCLLRISTGSDTKLVRRRALEALGFSSREEVPGMIEAAYNSSDWDWVVTALFAMGRSANSRWNAEVLKMLDHQHPPIRAEAASAAGELEITASAPTLIQLLKDSDSEVRMAAIWALSQVGGVGVRQALENMLETTDDNDEANQLDNALENLDFTEEMQELALFELPEDGTDPDEPSDDDFADFDEFISEDDED
jgi:HEAT repeat protein